MTHFVFCHGFGFDSCFWQRLAPFFSHERCSFIDLGYFNNPKEVQFSYNEQIVGIGHSIGLTKLLYMFNNFDYLIGLNGFINFLGSDQAIYKKRKTELKMLRSGFLKEVDTTLRRFYVRCGAAALIEYNNFSDLNFNLIVSDLQWLEKAHALPNVATLILSSEDDIIVPPSLTVDNFSRQPGVKLDKVSGAGHALGFKKPKDVYEKIMRFLDARIS